MQSCIQRVQVISFLQDALVCGQGGHVDRGVALASYSQDDGGVTVHLTTAQGGEETLRARWIVGCDGTRSAVRTGAGIVFEGNTYKELVRPNPPLFEHRDAQPIVGVLGRTCVLALLLLLTSVNEGC